MGLRPDPVRPPQLAAFAAFAAGTVTAAVPLILANFYASAQAAQEFGESGDAFQLFLLVPLSLGFGAVISRGCGSVAATMYGRWCHSARQLALVPLRVLRGLLIMLAVLVGLSWLGSSWVPAPGGWLVIPAVLALSFWVAFLAYWVTWLGLGGSAR